MALTPQSKWARVPSTRQSSPVDPRIQVGPLVPEAPEGQPMVLCSPAGGGGRLFPATPENESTGEMVEVPARMPAHSGASTPSCGGREGIGTGVSHRPEANRRIASFLYSIVEKEIIQLNHQPHKRDNFYCFFKRVNDAMSAPPPPC
jgi:hypothetical protein